MRAPRPHALLLLFALTTAGEAQDSRPAADLKVESPTFANVNCPVMGKAASSKLYADTTFGRIYVCCAPCIKKVRDDAAAAYKAAYPVTKKAENAACPVTGAPVVPGGPTVVLQGYEVALSSADCAKAAREEPLMVLAKSVAPRAVDVGNTVCPVTGAPTAKNVVAKVGDAVIRLSSPACLDAVRKDPEGMLKKAQEQAASVRKADAESRPAAPAKRAP